MKSLNGTLAKAINEQLGRKEHVIATRYDLHVLRTKAEVCNAVRYTSCSSRSRARRCRSRSPCDALPRRGAGPRREPIRLEPVACEQSNVRRIEFRSGAAAAAEARGRTQLVRVHRFSGRLGRVAPM
jgi:hypothetical protein